MPLMQTALSSMNTAFSDRNIAKLQAEHFAPGRSQSFVAALQNVPRTGLRKVHYDYLEQWPSGLLAAVQAVIHDNLQRESPLPITFAWQPAYDYSVTIHDVSDTRNSRGGITIVFTSRYPDDPHPLRTMK